MYDIMSKHTLLEESVAPGRTIYSSKHYEQGSGCLRLAKDEG